MSTKYIVELSIGSNYPPELAIAASNYSRKNNIYVFQVGEIVGTNYWTDWGGTYDNPKPADLQIFFGQFLQEVSSSASLIATDNSFYADGNFIYINIPIKPWQYLSQLTATNSSLFYSSAVKDETKPSDITYENSVGANVKYPVRLLVPSLNNKISDAISGSFQLSRFKINLINNDGLFDDIQETNLFNTPVIVKRSDVDIPELADFSTIRKGLVDSIAVTSNKMTVTGSDYITTFTESVCRKFTVSEFAGLPASNVDKDIPVGYGPLKGVPLFNVGTNFWIGIDPDYLASVSTVYDSDGSSVSFTVTSGVINAIGAATADLTGLTDNNIGEIITNEIETKSNVLYNSENWDTTETDSYISGSAPVGFYFKSGNVRKLINDVLKSDSAFLITKNDGLLTLRKWGQTYDTHNIDSWLIMKIPDKDTAEGKKFYTSSANIVYDVNESNEDNLEYLDDSDELDLQELYRKTFRRTFSTRLLNLGDAEDLATLIINRFGTISENLTVSLGRSVVDINMLDTVNLTVKINDRTFSRFTEWMVRETNPAQDVLVLESV